MKKIYLLAAGLFATSINVSAMPHDLPFFGINTVMDKCHIEDNDFSYKGEAKTKLTMNKNFVLATCKAEYIVDEENPIEIEGRVEVNTCMIMTKEGRKSGTGGFTVSQGGIVTAICKAPRP